MGQLIVFSLPIDAAEFKEYLPSIEDVMPRLSEHDWQFMSHNGWFQSVFSEALDRYGSSGPLWRT
jgi:hypothetical protein